VFVPASGGSGSETPKVQSGGGRSGKSSVEKDFSRRRWGEVVRRCGGKGSASLGDFKICGGEI